MPADGPGTARDRAPAVRFSWFVVSIATFASATLVASFYAQGRSPLRPGSGDRTRATLHVQNKVAVGRHGLEPDTPLFLSVRPVPYCAALGCAVPDSTVPDDAGVTAVCFTEGHTMTNANLRVLATRANPDVVTSSVWYGVEFHGRRGFLPEVYLTRVSRGGLGLRRCRDFPRDEP